nr:holo-ACP synthase [Goekera deserti]
MGIDVCPVERFAASLARTPGLRDRLFTADEQRTLSGAARTAESLAARFAAKEALAKALGAPGDLHWHDAEVQVGERGRPLLVVRGTVARRAAELGVTRWHVSLSHDGGIASAVVLAESVPPADATRPGDPAPPTGAVPPADPVPPSRPGGAPVAP